MALGSVPSNRATDPFWDKVIQVAETVTVYPNQRISLRVKDMNALVWYNPEDDTVNIKTWLKAEPTVTETEAESDA